MPVATLPADLPQSLYRVEQQPIDQRVVFEPEIGPGQMWTSVAEDPFTVRCDGGGKWGALTTYQKDVLQSFVRVTLINGTQPFDWADPWPGAGLMRFRFLEKPTLVDIAPAGERNARTNQALYRASFVLEWRPWYPPSEVG